MKNKLLYIVLLLFPFLLNAQNFSNNREKFITVTQDTIALDSLSIVPIDFQVRTIQGQKIDSSFYKLDYSKSLLIIDRKKIPMGSYININYKVFPLSFSKIYFHKDPKNIAPDESGMYNPFNISYDKSDIDVFKFGGLNKNGSISRGISFGNNQDVIVNSSMNMQLSGKLSEDVELLAAISDNNIPIQPEGNTQQIQEFDKVFIQLSRKNDKLIAGDFEFKKPDGYFLNINKKGQGLSISTISDLTKSREKNKYKLSTVMSGAISKGKYTQNEIKPIEGNQGPYKLKGTNNEMYIVVLSGTEKVFINGIAVKRGEENEYVIDYNTAEIKFTSKQLITRETRIRVEFEYSDKNYVRSMFFVGNELQSEKMKIRFNLFSEQDARTQPIQQTLTNSKKRLLANIGDDLNAALFPNVDSVGFNNNEVLYCKVDTIVMGQKYDSVFVYSTNPQLAVYRLGFALVGAGYGNYIQISSTANGKVFRWIAPIGGVKQGAYEPVEMLVTPKMKQLYIMGAEYKLSKYTQTAVELGLSNNDFNLFSAHDDADNLGAAAKYTIDNTIPLGNSDKQLMFIANANYEFTQKRFQSIERYRNIEFERDWNLEGKSDVNDDHLLGAKLGLKKKEVAEAYYIFNSYLKGSDYKGFRHAINSTMNLKKMNAMLDASILSSSGIKQTTQYIKQRIFLTRKLKYIILGFREEQEHDKFFKSSDTLQMNSFAFNELEGFINNADTTNSKTQLNYKRRFDFLPKLNAFKLTTVSDNISLLTQLYKNPNNTLTIQTTYRKLSIKDSILANTKEDNSILGRIEYGFKLYKGTITSNTYFEMGSGMEVKKEYSYLLVATGQGVYTWTDYNENGVKEKNEFEIATFPDQATYIKVYTPTNEYVKVFSNQFAEVLNIAPQNAWGNKKGLRKFLSRFSNSSAYRVDSKSNFTELSDMIKSVTTSIADSNLLTLNATFRNTFYFNRSNSRFGMDLNWQDNQSKSLLTEGFESRTMQQKGLRFRWNITQKIMLQSDNNIGVKKNFSELFKTRDFRIKYYETVPELSFQPTTSFRISISYKYAEKQNYTGIEKAERAFINKAGTEIKYNLVSKGSLTTKVNYIDIIYRYNPNSPVAFDILEGLRPGKNITWNVSYQMNVSKNMQLSLNYDGRKSEDTKAVHIGSVQLRAYF